MVNKKVLSKNEDETIGVIIFIGLGPKMYSVDVLKKN